MKKKYFLFFFLNVCLTFRTRSPFYKRESNLRHTKKKTRMGATPSLPDSVDTDEITNNTGKWNILKLKKV
jgi:hypothetical protein